MCDTYQVKTTIKLLISTILFIIALTYKAAKLFIRISLVLIILSIRASLSETSI